MSGRFTVTKRILCPKKKRGRGKEGRRVKGDRENQDEREYIPSPRQHQSSFGPKVLQGAEPWWIEDKCLWNGREVQVPVLAGAGRRTAKFRDLNSTVTMWYVDWVLW